MKSILPVLADIDRATPDGLLIRLADAGAERITAISFPRRGNHGHHTVTWLQEGAGYAAEGSTLAVALRRAVRYAEAPSASPEVGE